MEVDVPSQVERDPVASAGRCYIAVRAVRDTAWTEMTRKVGNKQQELGAHIHAQSTYTPQDVLPTRYRLRKADSGPGGKSKCRELAANSAHRPCGQERKVAL